MFKHLFYKVALGAAIAMLATAVPAQEQVIKIGSQSPLTGNLARVGNATLDGIKVAIQKANKKYDGKYQFKLLVIDGESSPAKAVAAVEKLASQGVVAFTGGYASGIVGPASAAALEKGIPYITSGAVAKGLTRRGYDGFFRVNNIGGYSKAMVGYIRMVDEEVGVDTVSVLYNKKESSTGIAHAVKKQLSQAGIQVFMHSFQGGSGNFTALMNRVRLQDQPDVIAIAGYENDYIGVLRSAQLLKPDVKAIVGVWSLATAKMNKEFNELVQGVVGTTMLPYPVHFTNKSAQKFAQAFKKMHGHLPDYLGLFGYAQTKLMIEAIVRAAESGELTGKRIAQEMHQTDTQTLVGRVAFDELGENPYFVQRMGQHQGDVIEIVWPESAATAELVLPGRPW